MPFNSLGRQRTLTRESCEALWVSSGCYARNLSTVSGQELTF